MKRAFLVLPLAIMLANCSSTRNSNSSSASAGMNTSGSSASSNVNAGTSASGSVASPSSASGTGSMSSSNSGSNDMSALNSSGSSSTRVSGSSSSWNNSTSPVSSMNTNWDVYDPNNYMMNPDKYRKPFELGKTGGWTYNKDWRRNTNFTAEAVGQWQLVLTPEVAANWMPDTRRPETYASFWTPEAVMSRYQATMAAAARTQDSIAALHATAGTNTTTGTAGGRKSSLTSKGVTGMATSAETLATGSGTTGAMGTGGFSSTNATTADNLLTATSNNVTIPFALTAVNGNKFMLPTLNMYIDNGSFTAFTGCNSAIGNIVVNGSSLHFDEASPSTNVECIGGFDQSAFIDRLRRADSYDVVNNQFRLKQGDQVLMVFSKKAQ